MRIRRDFVDIGLLIGWLFHGKWQGGLGVGVDVDKFAMGLVVGFDVTVELDSQLLSLLF